jgi:hypothetical protein
MILALITSLVVLLLISEPLVSLAQPAVNGAIVTKTYAVVSMVGGRLSFVTRKYSTGTSLDPYDRRPGALQDDAIDTAVLRTMANAVVEVAPGAKTELLEIDPAALQGSENGASDEVLAVARRTLTDVVVGRSWDFIVLLGPRREFADPHGLAPSLAGLGFYVDPGRSLGYRPSQAPDNIVKSDRFISPFVSSQVWLLDAKTLDVVATQSIYGYCRLANGVSDSPNPWQFFDTKTMLRMLTLVIQHDVGESTKAVIRKGLGMPELPVREHIEGCSHRYQ